LVAEKWISLRTTLTPSSPSLISSIPPLSGISTAEYDAVVKERVTQKERPVGLYLDKPNHKVWVKTWAELIRDCESRLDFVQQKLQIEVSVEEIMDRIAQLKASILRLEPESPATPLPVSSDSVTAEAPSPVSLSSDRRANKITALS
jgi:hypothetical protein